MTENDDSDVDRAENGKLMRLFEKPAFPFQKGPEGWLIHVRHANSISGGKGSGLKNRTQAYTERLRSSLIALISIFLRPIEDRIRLFENTER